MYKFIIFIWCAFIADGFAQTPNFVFNVELSDKNSAPPFIHRDGVMVYSGENADERAFFSKYTITKFYQTYPNFESAKLISMFIFETPDERFISDLLKMFPNKYLRYENWSGVKFELLDYYPNDYGTTSPVSNLGAPISLKSFDYVGAPKAWDFFPTGAIGNIPIGIADGKVNNSDADLSGKTTYLHSSYFNNTFSCGSASLHGTGVAAIAAAQGNNSHGMTGICPDCDIINTPYQIDSNYDWNNPLSMAFVGIKDLALAGVRVVNMSWFMYGPLADNTNASCGYCSDPTYQDGYIASIQEAINELHSDGVVLVAGAGNESSYGNSSPPSYNLYIYPASYDHVISVTVVQAENDDFSDEVTTQSYGNVSWHNEDLITPTGLWDGTTFTPFYEGTTTNSKVDICGPGYAPSYGRYLLGGCDGIYVEATSAATPYVSGTAALMLSLNPCLTPDEVEDILQLSSKNIESNPHNFMYVGRLGSGKLETGDTVEFVHEAMDVAGNAVLDGQDFWRFKFDLNQFHNKLTISNQTLRDANISDFTAKNTIEVLPGSDFRPNFDGYVDLEINSAITSCSSARYNSVKPQTIQEKVPAKSSEVRLYPNPNNGYFSIAFEHTPVDVTVAIHDIFGKIVYSAAATQKLVELQLPQLAQGMYFARISSRTINETFKFFKN